jgi:NTE family protein
MKPQRPVAEAVAASSAFPPVLSPVRLEFAPENFDTDPGPCHRPPFTTKFFRLSSRRCCWSAG